MIEIPAQSQMFTILFSPYHMSTLSALLSANLNCKLEGEDLCFYASESEHAKLVLFRIAMSLSCITT